jgi:hypothetical protein
MQPMASFADDLIGPEASAARVVAVSQSDFEAV